MQVAWLQLSEAESDFYTALHARSKTQFDTFVAEGKALTDVRAAAQEAARAVGLTEHPSGVMFGLCRSASES